MIDPTYQVFWFASRAVGIVAIMLLGVSVAVGLAMSGRLARRPGLPTKLKHFHESATLVTLGLMLVPAQRAFHQRLNDLTDPEPIPLATDFCALIRSAVPIVVQQTRLDSRQSANAVFSTIAYAVD